MEGVRKAKAEGIYKGRKPSLAANVGLELGKDAQHAEERLAAKSMQIGPDADCPDGAERHLTRIIAQP